mmetsp:Transcript_20254/g.37810  ORF Transcript_20254/g.37810 Transcript_20254/m.37810 type:complete len:103 (+) Transcript_20254:8690-8998(+)
MASSWSIQQRIRIEDRYASAQTYSNKMADIAKNSNWHERQSKFEVARANAHATRTAQTELETANQELKLRRQARLRHLLESEALQYERELADRGLAIYKDRL